MIAVVAVDLVVVAKHTVAHVVDVVDNFVVAVVVKSVVKLIVVADKIAVVELAQLVELMVEIQLFLLHRFVSSFFKGVKKVKFLRQISLEIKKQLF
jgi:hypothetical protein